MVVPWHKSTQGIDKKMILSFFCLRLRMRLRMDSSCMDYRWHVLYITLLLFHDFRGEKRAWKGIFGGSFLGIGRGYSRMIHVESCSREICNGLWNYSTVCWKLSEMWDCLFPFVFVSPAISRDSSLGSLFVKETMNVNEYFKVDENAQRFRNWRRSA